jgi:hypothetical protein
MAFFYLPLFKRLFVTFFLFTSITSIVLLFCAYFKQNNSYVPFRNYESKNLTEKLQFLISVDIYELADTTGALILEVKARQQVVFPSFIHVKCYEITTIGINGSDKTTSHYFYKLINTNAHLSERNGFKLLL